MCSGILIPGVREVRAPLVVGRCCWVGVPAAVRLLVDSVFAENLVSPGLQSIYDLLGRAGMLVAGAIVVYLVGTVLTRLVTRRMRQRQVALAPRITASSYLTAPTKPRLLPFRHHSPARHSRRICRLCQQRDVPAQVVLGEIVLSGGKRLLADQP